MKHAIRQSRLDALCIRETEGTLTKQERTELDALFAERDADVKEEKQLLAKIEANSRLPDQEQHRYWQLRRKCEDETLTDAELQELQSLNHEWEARNVKRVKALCALAEQRGTTLSGVIDKFEADSPHRGRASARDNKRIEK